MTFQIERDAMLGALRQIADVVEGRATIPVLANVLMVAADGALTVTATNLDLQATTTVPAAIETPLSITAEKNKMIAAVQSMKPGPLMVAFDADKRALTIKQKRSVRSIATLPSSDFPMLQPPEKATTLALPAGGLLRMLDSCAPAISTEETRYYLCGVFVHLVDGQLRFAACDGFRVIRATMAAPEGLTQFNDAIIPHKTVTVLRKLLDKVDGEIAVAITDKAVLFEFGQTKLRSKLVDGDYPDYSRTIPASAGMILSLARDALIEPAIAVAAIVNAEGDRYKTRAIAIDCSATGEHEVRAQDSTGAIAVEPLDAECGGDTPPFKFGVNQQYLVQIARVFAESARLALSIADAAAPMRITSDKDPDLLAVIMPMRV